MWGGASAKTIQRDEDQENQTNAKMKSGIEVF